MVRFIAAALCSLVLGCKGAEAPTDSGVATSEAPRARIFVSLLQLIANPERYDGQDVGVMGYCWFETDGNALYLHEEDERYQFTKNAVWLNFESAPINAGTCRGQHVFIRGKFSSSDGDFYSGGIRVESIQIQAVRGGGVRPP